MPGRDDLDALERRREVALLGPGDRVLLEPDAAARVPTAAANISRCSAIVSADLDARVDAGRRDLLAPTACGTDRR